MNIRDIVEISDDLKQTVFTLTAACSRLSSKNWLMQIVIRRKGAEAILATYPVWQADRDGDFKFYWDEQLWGLPAGFYEGTLQIDCQDCGTVTFRKRTCSVDVKVKQNIYSDPCNEACDEAGLEAAGNGECPTPRQESVCGATPFNATEEMMQIPTCSPYRGAGVPAQVGPCNNSAEPIGTDAGGNCGL